MVCIRTPQDDEGQNRPFEGVSNLLNRMAEDLLYVKAFVTSLELNKFESVHQKYDKPRVLIRENDDCGVSISVRLNPLYISLDNSLRQIIYPSNKIVYERATHIIHRIENEPSMLPKLEVMLAVAQAETMLAGFIPLLKDCKTPPLLEVKYDPDGLPLTYKVNEHAVDVSQLPDGFGLNFKKAK